MIALMLAAAVSAAPVERPALQPGTLRELEPNCRVKVTPVSRAEPVTGATKLGDLPKAHLMLPVDRMVRGCPIPTFVRYEVEGDGRATKPAR